MPVLRQLGASAEYYGPGGRWISNGCFIGAPEDWPAFQRAYLCNSPYSTCPIPCPSDTCGGGNAAACPGYVAPAQTPASQVVNPTAAASVVAAPAPSQGKSVTSPTITVETSNGQIEVPAEFVPGVSDGALIPARIHIPNIWDSLDPSKVSQFEYRGLATSLPSWISDRWRETLAPTLGPVAPGADAPAPVAASGDIPLWVWAAIGAAAWAMREKRTTRKVAA